jgi:hypothetical protein
VGNDAITFDVGGRLINGQHRLSAVCKAGGPAEFVVLRGVPASARDVMDMGRKRSVADALALDHGIKDGLAVAAIANVLAPVLLSPRAGTVAWALYLVSTYREAFDWVQSVMGRRRSFYTHASILAAMVIGRHHHPEETAAFHAALINPVNVPPSRNAVLKLRDLHLNKLAMRNRVWFFYKACNALWSFINETPIKALQPTDDGFRALRHSSFSMVSNTSATEKATPTVIRPIRTGTLSRVN